MSDRRSDDRGSDGMSDDDLDALYRRLPVAQPPTGFAERIVAESPGPRRRWWIGAAAALAAAAVTLLFLQAEAPAAGELTAEARMTVRLDAHTLAVAEPGAVIAWRAEADRLTVDHRAGRVFYRVDDSPLTVHTPAGDAIVAGTCFTVEIEPMSPTLKAGALGALIGAAATIAVYEGRVRVATPDGDAVVAAGHEARLDPGQPPVVRERAEREAALEADDTIDAPAEDDDTRAMRDTRRSPADELIATRAELNAARHELARVQQALDQEKTLRTETEGEPVPFPADLPAHFLEDTLRGNIEAALKEAQIEGEVVSIDCAEYPCIVYADMANDDDSALDALSETEAMAVYKGEAHSISAMGRRMKDDDGGDVRRTFAGIAIMPRDDMGDASKSDVGKRLRFRNQQAFEAFQPEIEAGTP